VCETEITSLCFCLFDTHDHFFDLVILVTEFYYSKFTLCGPCEKVSEISRGSLPSTAPPLFPVRPCFSSLRLHDAAGRLFSDRSITSLPIPTSRPRARGHAVARLPPPARLLTRCASHPRRGSSTQRASHHRHALPPPRWRPWSTFPFRIRRRSAPLHQVRRASSTPACLLHQRRWRPSTPTTSMKALASVGVWSIAKELASGRMENCFKYLG
jgi:hypothetical protein